MMIDVKNLTITFQTKGGPVNAVKNIDFSVKDGECYGLVGESGSGKSTVLRALSGLNPDWTGDVRIAGEKQGRHRPKSFHKFVQMVFQDPYGSLHPRMTIDSALDEALAIHGLDNRSQRVERALYDVGLPVAFRFRYPHQLSGGQRQRVAIARALILEPKVLLLDEPTSALDVSVQAEILNLLRRLKSERGLTYVLVTHNLAVVGNMCDRVAVMRHGEIVEETTVDALRAGTPEQAYTRQLLLASQGYDREAARQMVEL
jgi:peptide/nickel transport system ATP-binding protein